MKEPHPIAEAFPKMQPAEFNGLVADIKQNGLHQPVVLYEGKVLDGVHRAKACDKADRRVRYDQFNGDNPAEFAISANIKRRHLTKKQQAHAIINALKAAKDFPLDSSRKSKSRGRPKGLRSEAVQIAKSRGISAATVGAAITEDKVKTNGHKPQRLPPGIPKPVQAMTEKERATARRSYERASRGFTLESTLADVVKLVRKQRNPEKQLDFEIGNYRFAAKRMTGCEVDLRSFRRKELGLKP